MTDVESYNLLASFLSGPSSRYSLAKVDFVRFLVPADTPYLTVNATLGTISRESVGQRGGKGKASGQALVTTWYYFQALKAGNIP